MQVFNQLSNLPAFKNAVITIGSFDGVHKGHQKLFEQLGKLAEKYDGESVVITFHPHPRKVLHPADHSLQLLSTIDEKVSLFNRFGIANVVVVPFTKAFASQSPEQYIEQFLIDKFKPRCIVIGYDHRFGKDRKGDIDYLKKYQPTHGFDLVEIAKEEVRDIAVSSTKIRKALQRADIQTATRFLNHYFSMAGTVVSGQHIGRTLGFPTANLDIVGKDHKLIPPKGVYAVFVHHQQKRYEGMLYIGNRPVLKEHHNTTIEVNIFDFDKSIYGDRLLIDFVAFIRSDMQFDKLEALKQQLLLDQQSCLEIFKKKTHSKSHPAPANPPHRPSVAVVILNYNGQQYLQRYLPTVLHSTYPNTTVHVIDNASTDDSVALLERQFPEITVHKLDKNYGFAGGYNEGLAAIEADYLVLLNSDVAVESAWLEPLVERMESDERIACCQPKIRSARDRSFFEHAGAAGGYIDRLGYPFCRGRIMDKTEKDVGQYDTPEEIFWTTGAAMIIGSKLWKSIGGFDADYFAHLEEIDLCWRLQRAGFKVMIEPLSVVYHEGGGTLPYGDPKKTLLNFRNSLFTILKNMPPPKARWLIPLRLVLDGIAAVLFLVEGKWAHIGAIAQAHIQFYRNYGKYLQKRKQYNELIQKTSIVPKPSIKGMYQGSIVWQFFIKGHKKFSELD